MLSRTIQLYKKAYSGLSINSWYLCLVMFINRSGTMVIPFMTIYCTQKLHFTVEQTGIIMGLFGIGSLLGAFIGGKITDKYGFYYVQVLALLIGGLLFILLGFQRTFVSVGIFSFILSACNDAFRPANSTAVAHYSTEQNRTRSNSLNRLAVNLGWAFGGFLGGTLAHIDYHLLFWVDGCTNILAALMLIKLLPFSKVTKSVKDTLTNASTSAYRDWVYLIFIGLLILYATCFFQLFTMQPLFYKTKWHFNEQFIGGLMGINGLLVVLFEMVIVHNLEGKNHPLRYIYKGILLVGAGFVLLNFLPSAYYSAYIILLFITLGEILSMPFMNSFWIMRTNARNRGEYAALYSMGWSAASIMSPVIGGQVIMYVSFNLLWWITGAICLAASIGIVLLYRFSIKKSVVVPLEETVF
ncbi:MFS transporter [Mucilaginibacter sp. BT774]|uniref:MFS transporter n=1 Tax=Mucilaginibacter sp. BT774 TaxID=3062276 RepID=UPI002677275D|nr:MFS transporter [Mucilaginibacter sp. BT774]MDO3626248.1 MFS transporter [Mucilaginibacter sp. BT774]